MLSPASSCPRRLARQRGPPQSALRACRSGDANGLAFNPLLNGSRRQLCPLVIEACKKQSTSHHGGTSPQYAGCEETHHACNDTDKVSIAIPNRPIPKRCRKHAARRKHSFGSLRIEAVSIPKVPNPADIERTELCPDQARGKKHSPADCPIVPGLPQGCRRVEV